VRRIYCYGSLDGLCESAAGQRRMLGGGGAPAERLLSLNLSEWATLFRVGVATETGPWTESDIRFAANCWATGVIVSNEERFGNPYGPPELLARRPESERAAICQALAERVYEETQQLLARAGAEPPGDYGGCPVRQTATGSWEESPTVIFAEPASQPTSTDSSESDARRYQPGHQQDSSQTSRRERARRLLTSLEQVESPAPVPRSSNANHNGATTAAGGRRKQARKGGR
jgi:hypothetical protein